MADVVERAGPGRVASSWYLETLRGGASAWRTPVKPLPFLVGRRPDADLVLSGSRVSGHHAELRATDSGALEVSDLGSTNGTLVNGEPIESAVVDEGDVICFAEEEFRLVRFDQLGGFRSTRAVDRDEVQEAMVRRAFQAEVEIRQGRTFTVYQPIVDLGSREVVAYEALARAEVGGEALGGREIFAAAERLELGTEVSRRLRERAVRELAGLRGEIGIYLNMYPGELRDVEGLIASLVELRRLEPDRALTLEVHEAAVVDPSVLRHLASALQAVDVGVAFDDFGTGQDRLVALAEVAPTCLKFDMALIRSLHQASERRREMLAELVALALRWGIQPLAEGIEVPAEEEACRALGFRLGQGYLFGEPEREVVSPSS